MFSPSLFDRVTMERNRADEQDQIASAAYDRILRVWDVESAKQVRTFSGHTQSTLAVDYDNTGKLLASGYVLSHSPLKVENYY